MQSQCIFRMYVKWESPSETAFRGRADRGLEVDLAPSSVPRGVRTVFQHLYNCAGIRFPFHRSVFIDDADSVLIQSIREQAA